MLGKAEYVVFNEWIPQKAAGILPDPPISLPIPNTEHLEAIIPASPPDEPPGVLSKSQGF